MYKAMKSLSKSKQFRFHGSFSIVAKPDTDNLIRTKQVADELRKIARIPHKKPIAPVFGESYRVSFNCTCLAAAASKPVGTLMPPDVFATPLPGVKTPKKQGELAGWAGLKLKHSLEISTPRCEGIVVVLAEPGMSHYLGIPSQKVTVSVEH
ncbi:hypothetical protein DXG03_009685 [Asterophora parasitica]|uniref:Uncharacterized protein n=1 Tax=Asterophora parasitica TaxID=117018 RepID=A0A9P7K9S2_9AGAR|nr:hypothetical protein DXG03_009685 [Asterophora parasitica]